MTTEQCDFCRNPIPPKGFRSTRHFYRLGAATLLHCHRPDCRAKGKEWRIQRLKEAAEALGLTTQVADSPVSAPQE